MTARQQWAIVAIVVAALGLGLWGAVRAFGSELFPVTVGSQAPAFTARDVRTGAARALRDYEGQVVLLNVWATWCQPCQVEMPSIEKLYRQYGPMGLRVVAVSVDQDAKTDSVRAFADHYGLTFDVLHDAEARIATTYQTTGYPETFIIGRDGVIRRKWIGAADWNSLGSRTMIAQLLGVSAPTPVGADTLQRADSGGLTLPARPVPPAGAHSPGG